MKKLFWMMLLGFTLGMLGCKKEDAIQDPNVYYVPSALFFRANIEQVPYYFPTNEGDYSNISTAEYDFVGTDGKIHFKSTLVKDNAPTICFAFRNFYQGDSLVTDQEFQQIFGIGARDYLPSTDPSLAGIQIDWTDANGHLWTTSAGPQNGQFFNVDETLFAFNTITETVTMNLSFQCLLYDATGAMLTLNQGEAIVLFSKPVF